MNKPKKWTDVYPQGTPSGDEEQKFFIGKDRQSGLVRHKKYDWRSTAALVKESGLPAARVEQIIKKYHKMGLIFASPSREDHWAYWQRVPEMLNQPKSLSDTDKSNRIDDHLQDGLNVKFTYTVT